MKYEPFNDYPREDEESRRLKTMLQNMFGADSRVQTGKFHQITRGRGRNGHVLFDVDIEPGRDHTKRVFIISGLHAGGRGKGLGKGRETVEKLVSIARQLGASEVVISKGADQYWHKKLNFERTGGVFFTHGIKLTRD